MPEGTFAKAKAAPATPKKRKDSEDEGGEVTPTKVKKPRAKIAFKSDEIVQDDDEDAGDVKAEEGVKEEPVEESV
jgi:hypothetical protein